MADQPSESSRARTPWVWGGAILLLGTLAALLVGAAALLWQLVDVESLFRTGSEETPPAVEAFVSDAPLPELAATLPWVAHLYESERSARFFAGAERRDELTARWDSLLRGAGASVRRVTGAAAIDSLGERDLLVFPATLCTRDVERDAIRRYVERGGNLVVTWALGARDGACRWIGYGFVEELAGASLVETPEGREATYLGVPSGLPLAAGLPGGARIEIGNGPWAALKAARRYVFWSDWALNPAPVADASGADAAVIARRTESGGRLAWFGFPLYIGTTDRDQRLLDRLGQNAALWAAGHVLADVAPWPEPYRAALAVTQDAEHNFGNSRRLARRFRRIGVPVTFFVVTKLAMDYPELADSLLAAGEVGSHTVDHRQVAGRSFSTQLTSFRQARADIEAWAGRLPLGLRPPRELYDSLTLEAWRRAGGLYVAATNGAVSAVPELYRVESGEIVILPRVAEDDYSVMIERGETSADSLLSALRGGLDKARFLGGLHLLTVHTQLIDRERRVAAVEGVAEAAREAGDVWIARASELAEWWLRRSKLQLRVRERADRSAVLSVRNRGPEPVVSAWLQVYLPDDSSTYAAPELGETTIEAEYAPGGLSVKLPPLGPDESIDILLPRREASP